MFVSDRHDVDQCPGVCPALVVEVNFGDIADGGPTHAGTVQRVERIRAHLSIGVDHLEAPHNIEVLAFIKDRSRDDIGDQDACRSEFVRHRPVHGKEVVGRVERYGVVYLVKRREAIARVVHAEILRSHLATLHPLYSLLLPCLPVHTACRLNDLDARLAHQLECFRAAHEVARIRNPQDDVADGWLPDGQRSRGYRPIVFAPGNAVSDQVVWRGIGIDELELVGSVSADCQPANDIRISGSPDVKAEGPEHTNTRYRKRLRQAHAALWCGYSKDAIRRRIAEGFDAPYECVDTVHDGQRGDRNVVIRCAAVGGVLDHCLVAHGCGRKADGMRRLDAPAFTGGGRCDPDAPQHERIRQGDNILVGGDRRSIDVELKHGICCGIQFGVDVPGDERNIDEGIVRCQDVRKGCAPIQGQRYRCA